MADREAWAELPPLLGYNRVAGPRPGATVLLTHSSEDVGGSRMAVAAVMRVGRGKTMGVAFSSFWRHGLMMWGVGKTDRVSRGFWTQAVKWLATREDVDRVRVAFDKPVCRSGETVGVRVTVLNEMLQPVEGANVTLSSADSGSVYDMRLRDEGGGRYTGRILAGRQGQQRFAVRAEEGGTAVGTGTGQITVGMYSLEFEDTRTNTELLAALADASGGRIVPADSLDAAVEGLGLNPQVVTRSYRWRLWGQTWPFFLLVCLLGVEWAARRSRGMV